MHAGVCVCVFVCLCVCVCVKNLGPRIASLLCWFLAAVLSVAISMPTFVPMALSSCWCLCAAVCRARTWSGPRRPAAGTVRRDVPLRRHGEQLGLVARHDDGVYRRLDWSGLVCLVVAACCQCGAQAWIALVALSHVTSLVSHLCSTFAERLHWLGFVSFVLLLLLLLLLSVLCQLLQCVAPCQWCLTFLFVPC